MAKQLSNKRTGRITSGDIVSLTATTTESRDMTPEELIKWKEENPKSKATKTKVEKIGGPFYTYIQECIMERFLKRKLENDQEVLAFSWGKLVEVFVHNLLPKNYIFHSDLTLVHPEISDWVGTPDGSKRRYFKLKNSSLPVPNYKVTTITDIKCPLTLKSFFTLVRPLYEWDGIKAKKRKSIDGLEVMNKIRNGYKDENGMEWPKHKDGDKFYWQLVSNACITDADYAELIVFVPYREQLEQILELNRGLDEDEQHRLIEWRKEGELPFIYKQSGVKNINIIRFKVPAEDKAFLRSRVELAVKHIYQ